MCPIDTQARRFREGKGLSRPVGLVEPLCYLSEIYIYILCFGDVLVGHICAADYHM